MKSGNKGPQLEVLSTGFATLFSTDLGDSASARQVLVVIPPSLENGGENGLCSRVAVVLVLPFVAGWGCCYQRKGCIVHLRHSRIFNIATHLQYRAGQHWCFQP
jgi:hypothetical protein